MSAPAAVRAITRPASTYRPGHRPCTRCGIIRDMQKRGQQFCLDCKPYACNYIEGKQYEPASFQ